MQVWHAGPKKQPGPGLGERGRKTRVVEGWPSDRQGRGAETLKDSSLHVDLGRLVAVRVPR